MSFRSSPAAIFAVILVLAGCAYDVEVEYATQRLVASEEGCPSADEVARSASVNDAELVGERRIPRSTLCWYRVEDNSTEPSCGSFGPVTRTLEQLREQTRSRLPSEPLAPDPVRPMVACTDHGPVLLVTVDEGGCAPALEGPVPAYLYYVRDEHEDMVVREHLGADERSPLLRCDYSLEATQTRRPFSCGGAPGFGPR